MLFRKKKNKKGIKESKILRINSYVLDSALDWMEDSINLRIKGGWIPVGSPVIHHSYNQFTVIQLLVRARRNK